MKVALNTKDIEKVEDPAGDKEAREKQMRSRSRSDKEERDDGFAKAAAMAETCHTQSPDEQIAAQHEKERDIDDEHRNMRNDDYDMNQDGRERASSSARERAASMVQQPMPSMQQ